MACHTVNVVKENLIKMFNSMLDWSICVCMCIILSGEGKNTKSFRLTIKENMNNNINCSALTLVDLNCHLWGLRGNGLIYLQPDFVSEINWLLYACKIPCKCESNFLVDINVMKLIHQFLTGPNKIKELFESDILLFINYYH